MGKQRKPHRGPAPRKTPTALEIAAHAIDTLAERQHTTPDMVRKHIQVAMLDGLLSDDPQIKAEWAKIPRAGEIPTPEEVIAHVSCQITGYKNE